MRRRENMNVKTAELHFNKTEQGVQITDITRQIEHSVVNSHIIDGIVIVHVSTPHTSISTMEYEPGSISDMKAAISRLLPKNGNGHGKADQIYGYGLGGGMGTAVSYIEHSRKTREGEVDDKAEGKIMHAILGPSITIPIKDNRIMVGMWQKIVLLDLSKEMDQKKVILQIVGEFEKEGS
jgi:thiamine phosphate synthase YjbQ (UPF0047 family)